MEVASATNAALAAALHVRLQVQLIAKLRQPNQMARLDGVITFENARGVGRATDKDGRRFNRCLHCKQSLHAPPRTKQKAGLRSVARPPRSSGQRAPENEMWAAK